MVARTELLVALGLALALTRGASADPSNAEILGDDPGWRVEDVELRTSFLSQRGHGYQSQDGPLVGPGSESMWIFQPSALITLRQSATVTHEITVPVDVITAASPDAVDATTSASRVNESVDVDVRTTIKSSERDTFTTRFAGHYEEPLSSGTAGGGWRRSLADDNATIGVSGYLTIDGFDHHDHYGTYLGKVARETANANVTASQLLSPTTVIDGSYGITFQHGTLDNGWNSVPVAGGQLTDERFPRDRVRHALSVRLSQIVPQTRSTLKAWYRAYLDDFGISAHTVELDAYQYVLPWLYARGSYRYHHQTGADFFTTGLPTMFDVMMLRTADSDLAAFTANEWTLGFEIARGHAPGFLRGWSLGTELMRYTRSNDLQITVVSVTIGKLL